MKTSVRTRLFFLLASFLLTASCHSKNEWTGIFMQKGDEYMKQGKYPLALDEYQKALHLNSKNAQIYLRLADVYLKMENCPVAMEEINGASILEPKIPAEYYFLKAQCLLKREPPDLISALKEGLELAIKLDPHQAKYYDLAAIIYKDLGKTELANESLIRARSPHAEEALHAGS